MSVTAHQHSRAQGKIGEKWRYLVTWSEKESHYALGIKA